MNESDKYSEEETARRRDAALRNALNTRPRFRQAKNRAPYCLFDLILASSP
jgi:hypothetical protein